MNLLAARLAGLPTRDLRDLADRSDADLVLAGYTPASVRQLRKGLSLGLSQADAEALLVKETPMVTSAHLALPATSAYVLDRLGFTPASIANYRLAVLLGASPTDAEDLLVMTPVEVRHAA